MIVVGIDTSLTGTGVAAIDTSTREVVDTRTIGSSGKADASLTDRRHRLGRLVSRISDAAMLLHLDYDQKADLVVIETPAYDSRTGHQHDRSGLWWLLVNRLGSLDIPVVEVTTGGVKKYATGKGNSKKDAVLLAVARRYPHVELSSNDEADALVLAAMAARALGHPIDDLPKVNVSALDAITWPDMAGIA